MKDSSGNNVHLQASNAKPITPNDDELIVVRGAKGVNLYVGATGDVSCLLVGMSDDDTPIVFENLLAGVIHPIKVKKVLSTNTSATGIIAVW